MYINLCQVKSINFHKKVEIHLRRTRLKKHRKYNSSFLIFFKTMLTFYMIVFSLSYLTTSTGASFQGQEQVSDLTITAGTWEEEEQEDLEDEDEPTATDGDEDQAS